MPYILFVAIIILIVVCTSKKRSRKKRDRVFKNSIKKFIEDCETKHGKYKDGFQIAYDKSIEIMVRNKEITPETLSLLDDDSLFNQIPQLKKQYEQAAKTLFDLANKNTVLISNENNRAELTATLDAMDYFDQKKKRSNDIIKTLPHLANLVDAFSSIHSIYNAYKPFTLILQYLLFGLKEPDKESNDFKVSLALCSLGFNILTTIYGWEIITTKYPKYNTPDNKKLFESMVDNNTDYFDKWLQIWYDRMLLIVDSNNVSQYAGASLELYQFVNATNKELGSPDWLPHPSLPIHHCIGYLHGSSLSGLKPEDHTRKELMRIYNLYKSGKMEGHYHYLNDPKYSNQ